MNVLSIMNKQTYIFHLMGFILPSEIVLSAVFVENIPIYLPTDHILHHIFTQAQHKHG